jgi:hypothetical protein
MSQHYPKLHQAKLSKRHHAVLQPFYPSATLLLPNCPCRGGYTRWLREKGSGTETVLQKLAFEIEQTVVDREVGFGLWEDL